VKGYSAIIWKVLCEELLIVPKNVMPTWKKIFGAKLIIKNEKVGF